jgi:hypothetical protein
VINPHNPIFDHFSVFDLTSLQGDIFLIVREVPWLLSLSLCLSVSLCLCLSLISLTLSLSLSVSLSLSHLSHSVSVSVSLSSHSLPLSSQKHAVRANRVLGQVVIPFSWIVDRLSLKLKSPNRSQAQLSGWFELFPYCKPSRLNRGGQYRPFIPGIPQYAGYGAVKPEKVQSSLFTR